ncbi:MAG: ferritin [Candidatus Cloacimonadota bacterium]|nr:ferritin [Candidatus Cloacimonadota bacterium]
MISKKLEEAINIQINKELYSEYFYLSMAAWLESKGMSGFANFFQVQVQEERFHAMKMYDYLNERSSKVILETIEKPMTEFDSVIAVFELAYKHEQFITKSINELMDIAISENDHATKSFLNWFIDEQVEEEASMDSILAKLKMLDGNGNGLFMIDKELSARTFNPPVN